VNEPVTLTLRTLASCPQLLDSRAVVLVLGGLPDGGGLIDARRALRRIVGAFAARDRNRLALVDVAAPEAPTDWAATSAAFDALTARVDRVEARAGLTEAAWQAALATAQGRLAEIDVQHRPFLIIVDGSGAAAGQATVRAKIAQLGSATRDAVGHIVLVDLTSDGRLFFPLANGGAPDAPFVTAFPGASTGRSIDQVVGMALAAFDAPISDLRANILTEGRVSPSFTCVPIAAVPPAYQVRGANAGWLRTIAAHSAQLEFLLVLTIERPMSAQLVEGSLAFERSGTTTLRQSHGVADVSSTTICAAPPSPAALACPPPPDASAPRVLPKSCPPQNARWLPYLFYWAR
jgi:hypothetical protein